MVKVSERERLAIKGVMDVLAEVGVEVRSEKEAWASLDLAAKMVSYAMGETMTAKALQKKLAVMVRDELRAN